VTHTVDATIAENLAVNCHSAKPGSFRVRVKAESNGQPADSRHGITLALRREGAGVRVHRTPSLLRSYSPLIPTFSPREEKESCDLPSEGKSNARRGPHGV